MLLFFTHEMGFNRFFSTEGCFGKYTDWDALVFWQLSSDNSLLLLLMRDLLNQVIVLSATLCTVGFARVWVDELTKQLLHVGN